MDLKSFSFRRIAAFEKTFSRLQGFSATTGFVFFFLNHFNYTIVDSGLLQATLETSKRPVIKGRIKGKPCQM